MRSRSSPPAAAATRQSSAARTDRERTRCSQRRGTPRADRSASPTRCSAPERYGSWARRITGPDYPYGPSDDQLEEVVKGMEQAWASGEWWDGGQPSASDDARHRAWWARYLRTAASPAMAQKVIRMNMRL